VNIIVSCKDISFALGIAVLQDKMLALNPVSGGTAYIIFNQ
jgi:hypothetical protein